MADSTPSHRGADRNLLFGILALQMDFISRDALLAAMQAWVFAKAKPLGQILVEQNALSAERHALLDALVQEHLKQHGNDPEKSLAAVSSVGSVREELKQIADADLHASLAHVSERLAADDATRVTAAAAPAPAGVRFRILRPHAKGGLGAVYVALDEDLHREVALKEIQAEWAGDPTSRERFVREAEITGRLEHPGVVPVYGLGHYADGRPFYAMRFIKGDSLKDAIAKFHKADTAARDPGERALAFRKLLGRFIDVCNAIAYAHSRGVLHRDLKPGNVMLGPYGETLVVDWGLAKPLGRAPEGLELTTDGTLRPNSGSGSAVTVAGSAVGTPAYMSPEQASVELDKLGPASDVYSLGATLYALLTGRAPVEEKDAAAALERVRKGDIPPPRQANARVPPPLEAVCLKAMALRPEDRYASARALADDVERWLADEPVSAWPEPWTALARRWLGRHRTLVTATATTTAVAVLLLAAATVLLTGANRELTKARSAADAKAIEANVNAELALKEKKRADDKAKEAAAKADEADRQSKLAYAGKYISDIRLLQRAWEENNLGLARDLLEATRPERTGGVDYRGFEWRYWNRLCHMELRTMTIKVRPTAKAPSSIQNVAFSPDSKRLASGSWGNTLKVWDAANGQELLTLEGGHGATVGFSPDGKRLANAGRQVLKIWDVASGRELLALKRHEYFSTVAFSPDGKRMAETGKRLRLLDVASGQELLTLKHDYSVSAVAFSPDGKRLASAGNLFTKMTYSPDGKSLGSAGGGDLKVWDAASGQELITLKGHRERVSTVVFSPDGKRLAGVSGKTVTVWDAASGQELFGLKGHTLAVNSVAFSPDGSRLASGSDDRIVKLWDAASGHELLTFKGHANSVWSIAFSSDGKRLASFSFDEGRENGELKIWNTGCTGEVLTLNGARGVVHEAFSPDGQRLASAGNDLKIWDATSGKQMLTLGAHGAARVAFSPDGSRLVSSSLPYLHLDGPRPPEADEPLLKVWDASSGRELIAFKGYTSNVTTVGFSPDGKRLASCDGDGMLKLWDAANGQEVFTVGGQAKDVLSIAFSPDGRRLATGNKDNTIKVWDTPGGHEVLRLKGHKHSVSTVAFSPDGKRLASGSWDETVKVWDTASGQELLQLIGHTQPIVRVAFSPDGKGLASTGTDQTLKLWDSANGREILTLKPYNGPGLSMVFSPDSRRLVGVYDGSVKLWDATSGQELLTLPGTNRGVINVVVSPDGKRLASGSADGTIKIWDAGTDPPRPGQLPLPPPGE